LTCNNISAVKTVLIDAIRLPGSGGGGVVIFLFATEKNCTR